MATSRAPAFDIDPAVTTKARERIQHVVVLMLENRSFDHMLGFLHHPSDEFPPPPTDFYNWDAVPDGAKVFATPDGVPLGVDPDHSHGGIGMQVGELGDVSTMGGFVSNYALRDKAHARRVMECLQPEAQCPMLAFLATHFAVCTNWHASVPGETWPNRNFAHAGTSDWSTNIEFGFYSDPTIFESLEKAKASWRIYYDGPPETWFFKKLWMPRWRDLLRLRWPRLANWHPMNAFYDHVAGGNLPTYAFIEPAQNHFFENPERPRQTNSEHPHNNMKDSKDFDAGEDLVRRVYNALRAKPELFESTLLVVTYDEHGGFWDRIPPPEAASPDDRRNIGWTRWFGRKARRFVDWLMRHPKDLPFDFHHLGVRVPAVLVSPWIAPGRVVPYAFDHASIPSTLRALFAPDRKPLTKRDEAARPFHDVIADDRALTHPTNLPEPPPPIHRPPPPPADVSDDPPEPTVFDLRLGAAAKRVEEELDKWRRRFLLKPRVRKRGPTPAPQVAPPASVEPGSPLDTFAEKAAAAGTTTA